MIKKVCTRCCNVYCKSVKFKQSSLTTNVTTSEYFQFANTFKNGAHLKDI